MDVDIQKIENLLNEFAVLPKQPPKEETFVSIMYKGSHYEKPASNILAFFFDTTREHGLKDLFVNSLVNVIYKKSSEQNSLELNVLKDLDFPSTFTAETEVPTLEGKYIDILLFGEDVNIVIENKIYASLYNRLDLYYKKAAENNKKVQGVVLSLYPIDIDKKNDAHFVNVTYGELFTEIKKNLGLYIARANKKYILLLLDFISNIEELTGGIKMDKQDIEFAKLLRRNDNITSALEVAKRVNSLDRNIKKMRNDINIILEQKKSDGVISKDFTVTTWDGTEDGENFAYTSVISCSKEIRLEAYITLEGCHFFIKKNSDNVNLDEITQEFSAEGQIDNTGWFVFHKLLPLDSDINTIVEFLIKCLNRL